MFQMFTTQIFLFALLVPFSFAGEILDSGELHREEVTETDDGKHIFVRVKRTTPRTSSSTPAGHTDEICKYKKGDWAICDTLTMLMTREDSLKEKHSSPNCDKKRLITKNCRDKANKDKKEAMCVFEKPKNIAWSDCQENGVKYRVLKLKKEKGANGCPSEKKMSKKCKIDKKKNLDKKKKSKKEKCEFAAWSEWTVCDKNQKQRLRKIVKGADNEKCVRKSTDTKKC